MSPQGDGQFFQRDLPGAVDSSGSHIPGHARRHSCQQHVCSHAALDTDCACRCVSWCPSPSLRCPWAARPRTQIQRPRGATVRRHAAAHPACPCKLQAKPDRASGWSRRRIVVLAALVRLSAVAIAVASVRLWPVSHASQTRGRPPASRRPAFAAVLSDRCGRAAAAAQAD